MDDELEKAKTLEIRAMRKAENDNLRYSRDLQALRRRTQDPVAEKDVPSTDKQRPQDRYRESHLETIKRSWISMLDTVSDQWLLEHHAEYTVPR